MVFLSLKAESKTVFDINISAKHNRLQNTC